MGDTGKANSCRGGLLQGFGPSVRMLQGYQMVFVPVLGAIGAPHGESLGPGRWAEGVAPEAEPALLKAEQTGTRKGAPGGAGGEGSFSP